ncbi:hypothetical protein FKM82_014759 [Ascaphus truei]
MRRHLTLLLILNFLPCLCQGVVVTQNEKLTMVTAGNSVNLHCQHNDESYYYMFWYQQKPGEGLEIMVYSTDVKAGDMEEKFKARWSLNRTHILNSTLRLKSAESQDAAVYFCAVSKHSHRYKSSVMRQQTKCVIMCIPSLQQKGKGAAQII